MPSRRAVLHAGAAAAIGSGAGCLGLGDDAVSGYVQLKEIYAGSPRSGYEAVLSVHLEDATPPEEVTVNYLREEWADRFETPREPVVSESLDEDLHRSYDRVRYILEVCAPAWGDGDDEKCYNDDASREDFNAAQVFDRVQATHDDETGVEIHDVDGSWAFEAE